MKLFRSPEEKQERSDAEALFQEVISDLATSDVSQAMALVRRLDSDGKIAALGKRERRKLGEQAFVGYAENALADDHLTEDEEEALGALAETIGFEQEDFERHGLYTRLQIAKLNAGRLPVVESPHLMTKRGEVVHLEASAALMKEVAVREWQGGSRGVSFRVARGVRYHVGSTSGHMVTVGTQLQMADTGILAITNQRCAYLGSSKTVDMPYAKLLGMQLYTDAISFSLSNRQNAPLIKVTMNTDVLGALINAAIQASDK
jgi:hypothetical protein